MSVPDAAAGRVSLPVHPYLHNSIGAVQGGAMALLGEVAAAEALGAAAGLPAASMVVTDLQVAYLTLGRVGPIVTRTTVLDAVAGSDGDGAAAPMTGSAVVELVDTGCRGPADHGGQRPGDVGRPLRRRPGGRLGRWAVRLGRRGPLSGIKPTGPVDARHYMSEYFRLERWEIPPADGAEGFSEFGGRMPLDDHHRGAGGGLRTGALLTNIDSVGGFLAGLSVLPRWIVTTSLMATVTRLDHRGPLRVHGRVLRRGRNSVVAGLDVVDEGRGDRLVAASTATFAVLDPGDMNVGFERPAVVPMPPPTPDAPAPEEFFCIEPGAGATTRLELADHLRNPWGILHGGAVAVLADVAACRAAAGAGPADGGPGPAPVGPTARGRGRHRAPLPATGPGRAGRGPVPGARGPARPDAGPGGHPRRRGPTTGWWRWARWWSWPSESGRIRA